MNKSQLRKKLLHYRRTLTKDEIKIASEACCIQLLQLKSVQASQNIAVYLSINHEIDLTFFINEALNKKKTLYLPCLDNQHLIFRQYQRGQSLIRNKFSILEPSTTANIISPQHLDLVITPLLAVDQQGYRLGMGGGYYDRTFAFIKHQQQTTPRLVAVAYDWQMINPLPHDDWDIKIEHVIFNRL